MKRAAILVIAIATLVMIVSPSASLLASSTYPTKSGTNTPSVIAPGNGPTNPGPSTSGGGGSGGGGGGEDQGDADGLSGLKVKPLNESSFAVSGNRVAVTLMMWWRYMLLIR
jgi:hypothetical protein